jgi:serpin B
MDSRKLAIVVVLIFARHVWSAEPKEITPDVVAVAKGNNEFAAELYAHLAAEESSNLFFSPYSISTVLAMTCAGARGETAEQMFKVLHFPLPQPKLHPAFAKLRAQLTPSGKVPAFQLRTANRLWGQKGAHILPDFLKETKEHYGAEIGLANFRTPEPTRMFINSWVEKQTDRRITDLVTPGMLNADTRFLLTNAIYFKAGWLSIFNRRATSGSPFQTSGTERVTVPMMYQKSYFRYVETETLQILELPYSGSTLSMLILLPRKVDGLNDLQKLLTNENLQRWTAGLKGREVHVHLPRFRMVSEFTLEDALGKLGMPLAFSKNADFSGISNNEQLIISHVVHKAFVEVNEEGAEAAAATGGGGVFGRSEPIAFRADHPFVFLIRDDRTQCILFLGHVLNPLR